MYREWKPQFYPQEITQRKFLEFYSRYFNTLEINSTFYKFPITKNLEKFYNETPAEFRFSLKVPRLITHYKKLKDCENLADDFYSAVKDGLKEKIGCILFQFPPGFKYSEENLNQLAVLVNKNFNNVAEFRNASWLEKPVIKKLEEYNIIVSGLSHPLLPEYQAPVKNNPIMYYRFHGIPKLFYSDYSEKELMEFAKKLIKDTNPDGDIYIYFNNTASMAALKNASFLKEHFHSITS